MGEMRVPADALYGAQTARAVENFPISGLRFPRSLHPRAGADQERRGARERRWALPRTGAAIERAAEEVVDGRARRSVRRRHLSDRQRHLHQHERQRGDRAAGRRASQRRRQSRAVEQRRDSDRRMHIAAAETVHARLLPAMARSRTRRWRDKAQRVRRRDQDRPHASAGRRAHAPGAGVQRLRAPGGGVARAHRAGAGGYLRAAAGRHGGRHGAERAAGIRRRGDRGDCARAPGCRSSKRANHFEAQAARDAVVLPERRAARPTRSR